MTRFFVLLRNETKSEHQHFFMKKGMQTEEMYEQLIAASSDTESRGRIQGGSFRCPEKSRVALGKPKSKWLVLQKEASILCHKH